MRDANDALAVSDPTPWRPVRTGVDVTPSLTQAARMRTTSTSRFMPLVFVLAGVPAAVAGGCEDDDGSTFDGGADAGRLDGAAGMDATGTWTDAGEARPMLRGFRGKWARAMTSRATLARTAGD